MFPTVAFHGIDRIDFGSVRYFPATDERPEFWTRALTFYPREGRPYPLHLYSSTPNGLRLPEETFVAREPNAEVLAEAVVGDGGPVG